MPNEIEILDTIENTGYKMTTVGELLRELAILPPMMPIQAAHVIDGTYTSFYFNGISIATADDAMGIPSGQMLVLHIGSPEAKKRTFQPSLEEQEAEKRYKALEMGREKKEAQEPYG